MEIADIEKYINDKMIDNIYAQREDTICERSKKDKENISKIKEQYPIDYEQFVEHIKNIPPAFNNTREDILYALGIYSMRENLIASYDNEKFYKIGFCDGIRTIIESIKNTTNN